MCVSPDIQPICRDGCGTTETVKRPRPAMANHAIYRLLFWEIEVGPLCKKNVLLCSRNSLTLCLGVGAEVLLGVWESANAMDDSEMFS